MPVYKTEGIVIRRANLGEADRVVTLFTRDHGKVSAVAKGARKPKSRFVGRLELFTHLRVLLAVGRTLDVVSQVEVIEPFASLRTDLTRLGYASLVAEAADRATPDREPLPEVFRLIRAALALISNGDGEIAAMWFTGQLLMAIGYTPLLSQCVVCSRHLPSASAFSHVLGGTLCETDRHRDPNALSTSAAMLKAIEFLLHTTPAVLPRLSLDRRMRAEVGGLLLEYLEHRLEVRLRSPVVTQKLAGVGPGEGVLPSRSSTVKR